MPMLVAEGGPVFWILVVAAIATVLFFVESLQAGKAVAVTIGAAVLLAYLGAYSLPAAARNVVENPVFFVSMGLVYLVIGSAWSLFRWYLFVSARASKYAQYRSEFLTSRRLAPNQAIPADLQQEFRRGLGYNDSMSKPELGRHLDEIGAWVLYWPLSAAWWVVSEPAVRAAEAAVSSLRKIYTRIADSHFKQQDADIRDFNLKDLRKD